jgi:AmmeMemoRadiSam system protein B
VPHQLIERIVWQLDEAFVLDSEKFQQYKREMVREFEEAVVRPACMVDLDANRLSGQIKRFFEKAGEVKVLSPRPANAKLRGIVVPHIDFQRGGVTEALAYEQMRAEKFDTFIVLGIAHAGVRYPFCAADKDFETPLGTARCNRELLDELNDHGGGKMLREQYAHKNEHSIEFVAAFLQAMPEFRESKIVPIICGGFFQELQSGNSPMFNSEIANFVEALHVVVRERERRGDSIGLIASVDLAHVGSRFSDDEKLTPQFLENIKKQDMEFLRAIESGDRDAMHAALAKDNNARNVDAHPAVYTLMAAFPELRGQLLDYQQAYDKAANSVVSFAAMSLLTFGQPY